MNHESSAFEPSLPLRGITLEELRGALLVNGDTEETLSDTLFSLENYICDFSKKKMLPLTQTAGFTDDELEGLMKTVAVISPFTLMMFLDNELQRTDELGKIPFSKKEAYLLAMFPDKLRARYKRNMSDRHSRELTEEESDASDSEDGAEEVKSDNRAFGRVVDLLFSENRPSFLEDFLHGAMKKNV